VPTLAGLGDQGAAMRAVEKLRALNGDPASDAFVAARALARCIPVVNKDEQMSLENRHKQAEFYADQAMAMLRQAVAKGYKATANMKKGKDLDPLRERADFKKLLTDLEAKTPAEKK
jgi:hypothetical protein